MSNSFSEIYPGYLFLIPFFSILIISSPSLFILSLFAYSLRIVSEAHLLFLISCLCNATASEYGSPWQHSHIRRKYHFFNICQKCPTFLSFSVLPSYSTSVLSQIKNRHVHTILCTYRP